MPGIEYEELPQIVYEGLFTDCACLLWKPTSTYGKLIANATLGPFSHATMALKWDDTIMSVGFEEKRGAVCEPLSNLVARYPGIISVFEPTNGVDRAAIKSYAIRNLVGDYKWANIRLIGLLQLPLTKLFFPAFVKRRIAAASHRTGGGICSQWVARAYGENGTTLIHKPYTITTPNDLGMSPNLEYIGTLVN